MADTKRADKQRVAKTLLRTNLGEPDGVVSRKVETLTDEELDRVAAVASEPVRLRKQLLKHTMNDVAARQKALPKKQAT